MFIKFAESTREALALYVLSKGETLDEIAHFPTKVKTWARANRFVGDLGQMLMCPDESGDLYCGLLGVGNSEMRKRQRFSLATATANLPAGKYYFANDIPLKNKDLELIGCLMNNYKFDKYKESNDKEIEFVAPDWVRKEKILALIEAEEFCCDLINKPANILGPRNLEEASKKIMDKFGGEFTVWRGKELLTNNFPLIYAVGAAASQEPRLIEFRYGSSGPKITLVGKGVCFDTGGLNLKPDASMGLMKKDMGGAANILALASMIMKLKYKCRLRVLIPAVENSINSQSFRPQDILISRKGLSVEINNTDAEGRLILADALTLAGEENPDLIVSMATLTGAARVALGAEVSPFFTGSDKTARELFHAGKKAFDPVWRMPFWEPYEDFIEPRTADLDNAPKGGHAGCITAALFLRRFVPDPDKYIHFDIFGWNPSAKPGRPMGGALQGPRALLEALPRIIQNV